MMLLLTHPGILPLRPQSEKRHKRMHRMVSSIEPENGVSLSLETRLDAQNFRNDSLEFLQMSILAEFTIEQFLCIRGHSFP